MQYSHIILGRYLYVPRSELADYAGIKKELTARSRYEDGPVIRMYDDSFKKGFGFPLHYFKNKDNLAKRTTSLVSNGHRIHFNVTSGFWPGQKEVVDKFTRLVSCGKTGVLLEAKAGFGKTVVLIRMLKLLGRTALVVVPRANLISQWQSRILQHTDMLKSKIGIAKGGKASWRGKSVVIGLVHTLALDRFGEDFKKYFGVVVFDEVDRSVPPATFAPVVTMMSSKYRIGASATFKRKDGLDSVFKAHIGESYIKAKDANRVKPIVLMVTYHEELPHLWKGLNRLSARGVIISNLAKSAARNILVARYVAMIWKSGRKGLVLSDRVLQLAMLRDLLVSHFAIPSSDIGFYCQKVPVKSNGKYVKMKGGRFKSRSVSEKELAHTASACKILLCTYGKFSIGSDVPDLSGLVFATPQSDTEQSRGRIERFLEGKAEPVIVDIRDTCYTQTFFWAKSRMKQYIGSGLKIKRYEVGGNV